MARLPGALRGDQPLLLPGGREGVALDPSACRGRMRNGRTSWSGRAWRPGSATRRETPAGYFELARQEGDLVEVASFGLLPPIHRPRPGRAAADRGLAAGMGGGNPAGMAALPARGTIHTPWPTTRRGAWRCTRPGSGEVRVERDSELVQADAVPGWILEHADVPHAPGNGGGRGRWSCLQALGLVQALLDVVTWT